jgi:hypothetical protein
VLSEELEKTIGAAKVAKKSEFRELYEELFTLQKKGVINSFQVQNKLYRFISMMQPISVKKKQK